MSEVRRDPAVHEAAAHEAAAGEPTSGSLTLINECELAAPPERVWRALTEPEVLSRWLLPNDIRPERGASFTLRPSPGTPEGPIECQVLEAEPPRLLRYTWRSPSSPEKAGREPALDTTVTFELFPTGSGGTRLRVSHAGFPSVAAEPLTTRAQASGTSSGPCGLRWAA